MPRVLAIWLLLMVVESIHGTLRTLYLAPLVGDGPARQWSILTGAILIFLITRATIRWLGVRRAPQWLSIGALWVMLTLAFELTLGRVVLHMDWSQIASDYDPRHGGLMLAGLAFMLVAPLLAARATGRCV